MTDEPAPEIFDPEIQIKDVNTTDHEQTLEQIRKAAGYFEPEDLQRQIRRCTEFLSHIGPDLNPSALAGKTSYGYRHLVEKAAYQGFLSEGGYI